MKKITKICPVCSNNFIVNKCHQDRYATCSRECGGIYRRKPLIKSICHHCNIEFISKRTPTKSQKFCSHRCAANDKINKIDRTCAECKSVFQVTPYRIKSGKNRGTYCSRKCLLINWNRNSIKNQKAGSYRRNAWKIYGKFCHDCNITDERILVIHHIDGNRKNGNLSNLVPVCHNCHAIRHWKMGDKRIYSGAF